MKKYIIIISILVLLGIAQFFRPERNQQANPSRYDIFHLTETPAIVVSNMKSACYDCHSNFTYYPWYASIAPASWIIDRHINKAKSKVNFSEWLLYDKERQEKIMLEVMDVIEKEEMPPKPYLWLHPEVKFDDATTELIILWTRSKKETIQLN